MTWTSAMTSPASYEIYGGSLNGYPSSNLQTISGMWHSAFDTGDRGVKVTFEMEVTITSFLGAY